MPVMIDPLDPADPCFVEHDPSDDSEASAISRLLIEAERTRRRLRRLATQVVPVDLEPIDQQTRNAAGLRIASMARAAEEIHDLLPYARDPVVRIEPPDGRKALSRLDLLEARALEWSHQGWYLGEWHPLYSAAEAHRRAEAEMPEPFARFVSLLVLLQNPVRAIICRTGEVIVPDEPEIEGARALETLLTPYHDILEPIADGMDGDGWSSIRLALIRHALLYHNRKPRASVTEHVEAARALLDEAGGVDPYPLMLHVLHGSRLPEDGPARLLEVIDGLGLDPSGAILVDWAPWSSLNGPQSIDWGALKFEVEDNAGFAELLPGPPPLLVRGRPSTVPADVWCAIDVRLAHKEGSYLGAGWAEHVVRHLGRVAPEQFVRLRIRRMAPNARWPLVYELPVPRSVEPQPQGVQLTVARLAASTIISLAMAYGDAHLEYEILGGTAEEESNWLAAIEYVAEKNHHEALIRYLDASLFQRAVIAPPAGDPPSTQLDEGALILGIDVGGTRVKARFYRLRGGALEPTGGDIPSLVTIPSAGYYADAAAFASALRKHIVQSHEALLEAICALGVSWPGAVRNGRVIAPSSVLRGFRGHEAPWSDASFLALRGFDLREKFEEVFGVPVGLINDGDAHVLAQRTPRTIPAVRIVLVAGTGTAVGVFAANASEPAALLCEGGKFIQDIGAPFKEEETYPVGVANRVFSAHMFDALRSAGEYPLHPLLVASLLDEANEERYCDQWVAEMRDSRGDVDELLRGRPLDYALKLAWQQRWDWLSGWNSAGRPIEQIVDEAGRRLADYIAQCVSLYAAPGWARPSVQITGGLVKGKLAERLHGAAVGRLREDYGFEVDTGPAYATDGRSVRHGYLHLPEPVEESAPSGPLGAAIVGLRRAQDVIRQFAMRNLRQSIQAMQPGKVISAVDLAAQGLEATEVAKLLRQSAARLNLIERRDARFQRIDVRR